MTEIRFYPDNTIFGVTALSNIFIEEYMRLAPGEYVKVYIYGLRRTYSPDGASVTAEELSSLLGMDKRTFFDALKYWAAQGIIEYNGDENAPEIKYYNVYAKIAERGTESEKLYKYREFNQRAQLYFGTRYLTEDEYKKFQACVEDLGMEPDAVLMLIDYCVSRRGTGISANYISAAANRWADSGVHTLAEAEAYIEDQMRNHSLAAKLVSSALGRRRQPTEAELNLSRKWTHEWGMEEALILYAADKMASISEPSFGYLDRILERYYEDGMTTLRAAEAFDEEDTRGSAALKSLLRAAGLRRQPSRDETAAYRRWTEEWGYTGDMLLAAAEASRGAANVWAKLNSIVNRWHDSGINTIEAAQTDLKNAPAKQTGKSAARYGVWETDYTEEELDSMMRNI